MFNPFYKHPPLRCYPSVTSVREASYLEIGPGRGDFLFELARSKPEHWIVAVEIKRKRYEKLKPRLKRHEIENVCLVHGDARVALPVLFRPQQFESCYILFSDPWPKDRHEKHRLFQSYFVHELARITRPGGEVVVAHDDARYLSEIDTMMAQHPVFSAGTSHELPETFYADKWRQQGRTLQALRYQVAELTENDLERLVHDTAGSDFEEWRERIEIITETGLPAD